MTTKLTRAQLLRLKDGPPAGKGKPANVKVDTDFAPIEVQFNPTSLRIQRQNNVDKGGTTSRTQARQNPSTESATLTFDLEFDTTEGDKNGEPLDVRKSTFDVRQFVEPNRTAPKTPPPRVLFLWGTLNFAGIVTSLTEDIDYFSPAGMALRAKLSVTIKEQDLAYEALAQDAGAQDAADATKPGTASGMPGSGGTTNPVQVALAQAGENLQQLLARLDADPAAWRSAMNGLASPLALAAGAQVQLAANASVGAGLGVTAGFSAGAGVSAGVSLGAALGIDASASASVGVAASASVGVAASASAGASAAASAGAFAGASAAAAAGFALSAGGGVEASFNQVAGARAVAAADAGRASFSVPGGDRGSAAASASAGISASVTAAAGAVARVDARTTSYGFGVPMNPRAEVRTRAGAVVSTDARTRTGRPADRAPAGPGVPPWQQG